MKKLAFFTLMALMSFFVTACGGKQTAPQTKAVAPAAISQEVQDQKILIAYFSRSGTTENIAHVIQRQVGGDLFQIETVQAYPSAYRETTEVAKAEREENKRPAIKQPLPDLTGYDVIFIGYPIWWHTAPMAVFTFMESYDLSGKTIIPFCTSGGSEIEESLPDIKKLTEKATLLEGLTANQSSDVAPWLTKIGLKM